MDDILFTREKYVGLVTLNRVHALNALTLPMILALQEQLQAWKIDNSIHAVVVRAAEGRAFCAGGDVRWLYEMGSRDPTLQMQFFSHEYRLNHFIHHLGKPYIVLMDGLTMGGGVGISLHGSHPVASERFVFAMPETSIGFFPDIGASYLLARCPGQFGLYLGLTGNRLQGGDAYALGLVKQLIASDKMPVVVEELLQEDLAVNAFARVTACLQRHQHCLPAPIMAHEQAINSCFHGQTVEDIIGGLQVTGDSWHLDIAENLSGKAPLSLKVTLAQIHKARTLSLADCLQMDYCLVQHFMQGNDFYEGVRALLIDKDKSPHWQPQTMAEVSETRVEEYFTCQNAVLSLQE